MSDGRPALTWQVGLAASLAIVLALAGAVTVFVRSSNNSSDNSRALNDLASSLTTVSTATSGGPPPTTGPSGAFVAQDAGFSAVFPATPRRQEQPVTTAGLNLTAIVYLAITRDEAVAAAGATMPITPSGAALQAGLDGGINGTAQNTHGTVVSRTMTTYLGVPAEDGVINTQSSGVIHERVLFRDR